ncbi:MerR family transcriptional regulator [Anaeromicrobium sediminis]|uniref:HTH merR-type domain-containing protein n=1 Tax=Anaeromicrobium sediminis TaxID=1478221 RepID=A0A267ME42_9FIRM|nr:MerR family transcriptional regulator [Anaeromicrobium sediminis]PAB57829.1 hypothetical protein CCE28_17660 [Anaeromicrobium sediminis]
MKKEREYLISDFAKMFNITKRTLQYYDKIDLLKPAYVKENGYRIYGENELGKLIEILIWKNIGLESDHIKKIFKDKTKENISNILEEAEEKINEEIRRIQYIKENIEVMKSNINTRTNSYDGIQIKELEERISVEIISKGFNLNQLEEIMAEGTEILKKTIAERIPFIEFGLIFNKDAVISENYTKYKGFYYSIPYNYKRKDTILMKKGKYICQWYEGKIDGIPNVIMNLMAWINSKGYDITGYILYSESFSSLYHDDYEYTYGEIQILIRENE